MFIAARLLSSGQMHGDTETLAWKMITRSDNAAANALYPRVGGDALIDWVKARYDVPYLGYRPRVAGHWGATRITAGGMAHFYAHLRRTPAIRAWLLDAMHHVTHRASNGDNQFFGLAAATTGFAVKQGWGIDSDDFAEPRAELNSTGFVNGDRFAVALFVRGAQEHLGLADLPDDQRGRAGPAAGRTVPERRPGDHGHVAARRRRGVHESRCTATDSRVRRPSASGRSRRATGTCSTTGTCASTRHRTRPGRCTSTSSRRCAQSGYGTERARFTYQP